MLGKPGAREIDRILTRSNRPNEEVLDEVYLKYSKSHPFLPVTHFIDHSTMGAEALVGLGLGHKVREWITPHRVRHYEAPIKGVPIPMVWRDALGRPECHGDWLLHFENELRENSFHDVLAHWIPRFAHEIGAFLFHGLIRTAHAVRALEHKDSPARRGELARGLALWAIGVKSPPPEIASSGAFIEATEPMALEYARMGAASFVDYPTIPNLHLVTGPMAYALIANHLDSAVHDTASACFKKTHARAIRAFNSIRLREIPETIPSLDQNQLDALAAQSNAHPIKLTEAALRAYQATEDDIFLRAVGNAQNFTALRGLVNLAKAVVWKRSA